MATSIELIIRLTERSLESAEQRKLTLRDFAKLNGWHPSDEIEDRPGGEVLSNGHLLVEHGLDNTAVLTFLRPEHSFSMLSSGELRRILSISGTTTWSIGTYFQIAPA